MLPPSTSLGKPVFAKIAASEVLYSHRLHTEEPTDGPASRHTDLHSPLHTQSPCAGRLKTWHAMHPCSSLEPSI